jgi:DNA-binding transcriptional MerR regulator/methylmalonyl-CoA mutase cobalamin-binding subunit
MSDAARDDLFPIKTAARLAGITPDLIRAWERRYGAVDPVRRRNGGARLYSREDVARLIALRRLIEAGRRIGDIAGLRTSRLTALADAPATEEPHAIRRETSGVESIVAALDRFDIDAVTARLGDALAGLGAGRFARQVAMPLLVEVGERWADGRGSIAHERIVSGVLRNLLGSMVAMRTGGDGPRIVLATPRGERHDIGLVMISMFALDAAMGVSYLGADVPAAEVVATARGVGATAVGLGVAWRGNRARAVSEVRAIRRALAPPTEIWLGGADAAAVAKAVGPRATIALADLDAVEAEMRRLRHARRSRRT